MPGNLAFVEQAVDVGTVDSAGGVSDNSLCDFRVSQLRRTDCSKK